MKKRGSEESTSFLIGVFLAVIIGIPMFLLFYNLFITQQDAKDVLKDVYNTINNCVGVGQINCICGTVANNLPDDYAIWLAQESNKINIKLINYNGKNPYKSVKQIESKAIDNSYLYVYAKNLADDKYNVQWDYYKGIWFVKGSTDGIHEVKSGRYTVIFKNKNIDPNFDIMSGPQSPIPLDSFELFYTFQGAQYHGSCDLIDFYRLGNNKIGWGCSGSYLAQYPLC